ncbi:hypothetical protein ACLOJK_035922 [Asimina triloba]
MLETKSQLVNADAAEPDYHQASRAPRCCTHDIGGWYVETFGQDKKGKTVLSQREWDAFSSREAEKRLHPAMYLLALGYRTLDFEDAKRRKWAYKDVLEPKLYGFLRWCKKLAVIRSALLPALGCGTRPHIPSELLVASYIYNLSTIHCLRKLVSCSLTRFPAAHQFDRTRWKTVILATGERLILAFFRLLQFQNILGILLIFFPRGALF